jgi:formylglycine-generating enzyme required for sulfatase activity
MRSLAAFALLTMSLATACSRAGFGVDSDAGVFDGLTSDRSSAESGGDTSADGPSLGDGSLDGATPSSDCPAGYVPVPALPGYVANAFCVMKYEAKADSQGKAVSQPEGLPWTSINRADATAACQLNGLGYDLITNDEWQAVARAIEITPINWKEGVVGGVSTGFGGTDDNQLNRGHSDKTPDKVLAASSDDAKGCLGTGQEALGTTGTCPGGWDLEKRTHTLPGGHVIWDVGGNVWEYVKDDNTLSYGADAPFTKIDATTHVVEYSLSGGLTTTQRNAKGQFGPAGDYSSLTGFTYGGLGVALIGGPVGGAVIRGGRVIATNNAGVFYVRLNNPPAQTNGHLGFRCVLRTF